MRFLKKRGLLSLFFFLFFNAFFFLEIRAAEVEIKVKNRASEEIEARIFDYVKFVPEEKGYTYTYYSNENGTKVFPFGNGKFFLAEEGEATIIVSGKDKEGRDGFIADYKLKILRVKPEPEPLEESLSSPETEKKEEIASSQEPSIRILETSLSAKRMMKKSREKAFSEFSLDVLSEEILNQDKNATLSYKNDNPLLKYKIRLNGKLYITVEGAGRDALTVTVNGIDFVFFVNITEIKLPETTVVLAPGDSFSFKVQGLHNQPLSFTSSNESAVVINKKGLAKAVGEGHSLITVKAGEEFFAAVVSVTTPLKRDAANYAKSYSKVSQYSQPKRMNEGYYDCSSLVWRAYQKYGHSIILENYAPVAAAMGYYYFNNNKMVEGGITKENIEKMVFMPGDLLFVEGKKKNKRFKNIDHVEMIYGYSIEEIDNSGKVVLGIRYANNHQSGFKGFVGRPNTDSDELSVNKY